MQLNNNIVELKVKSFRGNVNFTLVLLVKNLKINDISPIFGPYNLDLNKICIDFNNRTFFIDDFIYVVVKGFIDVSKLEKDFIFDIYFPKKSLILYQYYLSNYNFLDCYLIYLFFFKKINIKRFSYFLKKYNLLRSVINSSTDIYEKQWKNS